MNILHYSLGLPPYRSGGLPKYTEDLIKEQIVQGDKVGLLYPTGVDFCNKKIHITTKKKGSIHFFEMKNPLPVPLYHGIKEPKEFMKDNGFMGKDFEKIINDFHPEVLHIHTLMGLPLPFVKMIKAKGIRIIFTTHDYFGLCFKTNFIDYQDVLCQDNIPQKCAVCNAKSPSTAFIRLRNEPSILALKKKLCFPFPKRTTMIHSTKPISTSPTDTCLQAYSQLKDYYTQLFKSVDYFHFNSALTQSVFEANMNFIHGHVLSITHSNVKDNRSHKFFGETLRICFIGSTDIFKGLPILLDILSELNGYNWQLNIWGNNKKYKSRNKKITYCGQYSQRQLKQVYTNSDLVIVPSIWYETFSFVTLEALSFGTPVAVSTNVGAKDIVKNYAPNFIFRNKKELKSLLLHVLLNKSLLIHYHENILKGNWHYSIREHTITVKNLFYKGEIQNIEHK